MKCVLSWSEVSAEGWLG